MERCVACNRVSGTVVAPSSKSFAQRGLVAALLTRGATTLRRMTLCDDTRSALQAVEALGVSLSREGDGYHLSSRFLEKRDLPPTLFLGESGLLFRMMAPVMALFPAETTLTGGGLLARRPIGMVESPLRVLGATLTSRDGFLPLTLRGPIHSGEVEVDGSVTSQFLTGLLMALPLLPGDSLIRVDRLHSKPYVAMTLDLLSCFGIEIEQEGYTLFHIRGGQHYRPTDYTLEGDWSAASALLVAGCLAGEVGVTNLNLHSMQADRALLEVLDQAGACYTILKDGLFHKVITSRSELRAFEFDATDCPDLFPALVALASACDGESCIKGVGRLPHKESNRGEALCAEFTKMGIHLRIEEDVMIVRGGPVRGGVFSSHDDHRVAMALATAALRAGEPVMIREAASVAKSYPDFWKEMEMLQQE